MPTGCLPVAARATMPKKGGSSDHDQCEARGFGGVATWWASWCVGGLCCSRQENTCEHQGYGQNAKALNKPPSPTWIIGYPLDDAPQHSSLLQQCGRVSSDLFQFPSGRFVIEILQHSTLYRLQREPHQRTHLPVLQGKAGCRRHGIRWPAARAGVHQGRGCEEVGRCRCVHLWGRRVFWRAGSNHHPIID